jgi:hypothetical protein
VIFRSQNGLERTDCSGSNGVPLPDSLRRAHSQSGFKADTSECNAITNRSCGERRLDLGSICSTIGDRGFGFGDGWRCPELTRLEDTSSSPDAPPKKRMGPPNRPQRSLAGSHGTIGQIMKTDLSCKLWNLYSYPERLFGAKEPPPRSIGSVRTLTHIVDWIRAARM